MLAARPFRFPSRLYAIADTLGDHQRSLTAIADQILAGGAPLVQLRAKDSATDALVEAARVVRVLATRHSALLIINDRTDIAKLVDADGVHLGQEDLPPAAARAILGPHKIIGVSTHNLQQAEAAAHDGVADYLGFGPIYPTTSKDNPDPVQGLDGLRRVRERVHLPIVAIGGITAATLGEVLAAGADAVAMIGAIVQAGDIAANVRILLAAADQR